MLLKPSLVRGLRLCFPQYLQWRLNVVSVPNEQEHYHVQRQCHFQNIPQPAPVRLNISLHSDQYCQHVVCWVLLRERRWGTGGGKGGGGGRQGEGREEVVGDRGREGRRRWGTGGGKGEAVGGKGGGGGRQGEGREEVVGDRGREGRRRWGTGGGKGGGDGREGEGREEVVGGKRIQKAWNKH